TRAAAARCRWSKVSRAISRSFARDCRSDSSHTAQAMIAVPVARRSNERAPGASRVRPERAFRLRRTRAASAGDIFSLMRKLGISACSRTVCQRDVALDQCQQLVAGHAEARRCLGSKRCLGHALTELVGRLLVRPERYLQEAQAIDLPLLLQAGCEVQEMGRDE